MDRYLTGISSYEVKDVKAGNLCGFFLGGENGEVFDRR
jgi:hypothetical protein